MEIYEENRDDTSYNKLKTISQFSPKVVAGIIQQLEALGWSAKVQMQEGLACTAAHIKDL